MSSWFLLRSNDGGGGGERGVSGSALGPVSWIIVLFPKQMHLQNLGAAVVFWEGMGGYVRFFGFLLVMGVEVGR